MKPVEITKKFSLRKQTVSNLDDHQAQQVLAGAAEPPTKRYCTILKTWAPDCTASLNRTGCAPCPDTECAWPSQNHYTCCL